jgi:hypothetical protein
MPNYRGRLTEEVPTAPGDPKLEFFRAGNAANCYAYAINIARSALPSINPGELGPKGTEIAAADDSDETYMKACIADGLLYGGLSVATFHGRTDGYLAAFFRSSRDMHWRRQDSQGSWNEKLPAGAPFFCENQVDPTIFSRAFRFVAYYWVRPDVVKLLATTKSTVRYCIIL